MTGPWRTLAEAALVDITAAITAVSTDPLGHLKDALRNLENAIETMEEARRTDDDN